MRTINRKRIYTVRILCVSCIDQLGEKNKTFTKDENNKQNSPSFNNVYDFYQWSEQPWLYSFRVDMHLTKINFPELAKLN